MKFEKLVNFLEEISADYDHKLMVSLSLKGSEIYITLSIDPDSPFYLQNGSSVQSCSVYTSEYQRDTREISKEIRSLLKTVVRRK